MPEAEDVAEFRYHRILHYVRETPWAVMPEMLATIMDMLAFRAQGGRLTKDEIRARIGAGAGGATKGQAAVGAVAIIPLQGVIIHRADTFSEISGAASVERFQIRLRQALDDPAVKKILIDVDSPGGAVDGVPEAAQALLDARGTKPITAIANTLAASAAYWLATAADELIVTPSAEVGSIGVFAAHRDFSVALHNAGLKTTLISAGKYKVEANPFEPLSAEARQAIQARVDDYYGMFVAAVAKARGVSAADVRGGFGEGRVVGAREAVRLGMADRVATFDETVARLAGAKRKAPSRAAHKHDYTFR